MKSEKYKQVIAICEQDAATFEERMNDSLARVLDPEIVFDHTRPFTAYITYSVSKNMPEDLLELFEMLDGEHHYCEECPYFTASTDKRKKWGSCNMSATKTRLDSRACERFYMWRIKKLEQAKEEFEQLPFSVG